MNSPTTSQSYPKWLETALQGLTYWIGHRRCLYRDYPLAEAALVAELCNLIHAHLPDGFRLACEEQYSKLIQRKMPDCLPKQSRADLVIYEKVSGEDRPRIVIEVKRAKAPINQIDADIERLIAVRSALPDVTTYLIVVAEAERPKRFVSESGKAIRKHQDIGDGRFEVRRVLKAAHTFKEPKHCQYACLIETYPTPNKFDDSPPASRATKPANK
jgi:hypothetical protein